jgi:hypothetical protein
MTVKTILQEGKNKMIKKTKPEVKVFKVPDDVKAILEEKYAKYGELSDEIWGLQAPPEELWDYIRENAKK